MIFWLAAIAALGVGIWIGVGAPGWPYHNDSRRRHTHQRPLNPIAWGRTPGRERRRPRGRDERPQIRLK